MNTRASCSRTIWKFLLLPIIVFGGGIAAFSQAGRGGLNGLISDPAGAIVLGARVTALNRATGVAQSTVTTTAGLY